MDLGLSFLAPLAQQQNMEQSAARQPLELAHLQSTARLQNAHAATAEYQLGVEKRASEIMSKMQSVGNPSTNSPTAQIDSMAQAYLEAGGVAKATQLMHISAQIQNALSRATATKAAEAEKETKLINKLLANVKNQADWEQANEAYKREVGKDSPFAGSRYNPEFVDLLKTQMTEYQQKRLLQEERRTGMTAHHQQVTENIQRERLSIYRDRQTANKKNAGKDVGAPSKEEVRQADLHLEGMGLDADTRPLVAADIAASARALRVTNPGMSYKDAVRKAVTDARGRGELITHTIPATKLGPITINKEKKETVYKPGATSKPTTSDESLINKYLGGADDGDEEE